MEKSATNRKYPVNPSCEIYMLELFSAKKIRNMEKVKKPRRHFTGEEIADVFTRYEKSG